MHDFTHLIFYEHPKTDQKTTKSTYDISIYAKQTIQNHLGQLVHVETNTIFLFSND